MGYEIDFLPVGDGEKSGDAIALRFGELYGPRNGQVVIIIDGGFADTGKELVQHVEKYYDTNIVDLVVSTHPDADHANGLLRVIDMMEVKCLLMHQPWNHTDEIAQMFRDGRVTDTSISARLRNSLEAARNLETEANRRDIKIVEPFAGASFCNDMIRVVGPAQSYYESLLPHFRGTPEPGSTALRSQLMLARTMEKVKSVTESWGFETLDDTGETSAENNSSAVLQITPESGHSFLFTADAGIPALTNVADFLDRRGFDYSTLKLFQVPHHGSKRNVGPAILDRIIGPRQAKDSSKRLTAYISAAKDAPKHPSKKVTNALLRRGAWPYSNEGGSILHRHDAPDRGWSTAKPLPFCTQVED